MNSDKAHSELKLGNPGGICLGLGCLLAGFLWLADALLEYLWFNPGQGLWEILLPSNDAHTLLSRIALVFICVMTGIVVGQVLARLATQQEQTHRVAENLRITLDSIGDAIIATDTRGRVTLMNPVAEMLTGWSMDEARDKTLNRVFRIINADTREEAENPVDKVLQTGEVIALANHTVLIDKAGREFQIADSAAPVKGEDGKVGGVVLVFRDVTEDYALRRGLQEMAFLVNSAISPIIMSDLEGNITQVNAAFLREWGYLTSDEVLGKPASDFWQLPRDGEDALEKIQRTGKLSSEETAIRKDGSTFTVHISASQVRDSQNRPIALMCSSLDISERKEAEAELKSLRNYLSNIIDSMPSMLVGVDREGLVTQWNKTAVEKSGLTAEYALSKPVEIVLPFVADMKADIAASIQSKEIYREAKRARTNGEGIVYEDITIYPLVTNGAEGAVIRIDDVSEKMQMEEMMIQSEKMLSVGGLAAGMAHEINNPLAGIMQTAEVMANRLGGNPEMPANLRAAEAAGTSMGAIIRFMEARSIPRMLDTIDKSGRRVASVVNNMLSFARKSESTISTHRMDELIESTLELASTDYDLKKQYDFKQINIVKEYSERQPVIPCEGAKVQQVLLNILRNGSQAMQEAKVKDPRFIIRIRPEDADNMLRLEIEDNGPGMDEETRKRVFEPFFTTKPVGVGTGLGMSVSFFIITENHKGEMTLESSPGNGARFIIRLPME